MDPKKILLVDDEPMILALNRAYCQHLFPGAEISEAENGVAAFDQVQKEKPDLIISDVDMPVMGGVELLKAVKAEFPGIKFILVSGKMTGNLEEIARELGAECTLRKPFTFSEFKAAFENF